MSVTEQQIGRLFRVHFLTSKQPLEGGRAAQGVGGNPAVTFMEERACHFPAKAFQAMYEDVICTAGGESAVVRFCSY